MTKELISFLLGRQLQFCDCLTESRKIAQSNGFAAVPVLVLLERFLERKICCSSEFAGNGQRAVKLLLPAQSFVF